MISLFMYWTISVTLTVVLFNIDFYMSDSTDFKINTVSIRFFLIVLITPVMNNIVSILIIYNWIYQRTRIFK